MLRTATAAVCLIALPASGQVVLDTFDSIPNAQAGGPRTINTSGTINPLGVTAIAEVRDDLGAFVYDTGPEVVQPLTITWENEGAGLDFDAALLGITALEFDFGFVDQDFEMRVVLGSDNTGTFGSATGSVIVSASASPQTLNIDLASLSTTASFNASDVDLLRISINSPRQRLTPSLDFTLTEIRAVPAPGSLALLGVAGFAVRRRR